jgi:phage terminase large subunit
MTHLYMRKKQDTKHLKDIAVIDFNNPELYQDWIKEFTTPLNDPNIRYIFFIGGAGSSKSYTATQMCIQAVLSGESWLWLRKVGGTLRESCFKVHKEVINDMSCKQYFEVYDLKIKNNLNDSEVSFLGLDDPEKIKSIASPNVIVMEEGSDFDYHDFSQLDIRLRGKKNQKIIILSNKVSEKSWLKRMIKDSEDWNWDKTAWLEKTVYDNKFADQQYIASLENLKKNNPEYWRIYLMNDWGTVKTGLVYPNSEIFRHAITQPTSIGLDFGWNDPMALVYLQVKDIEGESKRRLYVEEKIYEKGLTIGDLIIKMETLEIPKDVLIIADNARPEAIQQISEAGFAITSAKKGAGSVKDSIDKVNSYDLFIRGKNLIYEVDNYGYSKNKEGNDTDSIIVQGNDHLCDAMRYGIQSIVNYGLDDEVDNDSGPGFFII